MTGQTIAQWIHAAVLREGISSPARPQVTQEAVAQLTLWIDRHPNAATSTVQRMARAFVQSARRRYLFELRQRIALKETEIAIAQAFGHEQHKTLRHAVFAYAARYVEALAAPYGVALCDLMHGVVIRRGVVAFRKALVARALMARLLQKGYPIKEETARKRVTHAVRAVRADPVLASLVSAP